MVPYIRRVFILIGLLLAFSCGWSWAVDPRTPAEWESMQAPLEQVHLNRWLPLRIRELEEERDRLRQHISELPQHAPRPLPDHRGYHSLPWDEWTANEDGDLHIEVQFEFDTRLGAIAFAPAIIPGKSGGYAFPKRFKIEVLDRGAGWVGGSDGQWVVPPPPYQWVEVVNWMDEDYPDPGEYPTFFSVGEVGTYKLRITIPKGEGGDGESFHSLGELYLFRTPDGSDLLGDNMMAWDTIIVTATDSLAKPPLWHVDYLHDGVVGLGIPLSEELSESEDFMVAWEEALTEQDPVRIMLDLGSVQRIGRVQLWPAEAPLGMAIPQFGFPGKVRVELSNAPDFNPSSEFVEDGIRDRMNNDNLLNVITDATNARYIRVTFEDPAIYRNRNILGLGEIRVSEFDEVWSLNCAVTAEGIPETGLNQLPQLVDGFSRKRRILREVEWIRGLAQRRPLDARLSVVERELDEARDAWSGLKLRASIWGGGLIGVGLLVAMGLQRLQRRHVLKRLKHRITRDLHDEVGSNLGSISLAAKRMERAGATPAALSDLTLLTREASASLKDVVWVIDQSKIHLPALLGKLAERAQRVLGDVELIVDLGSDCSDRVVPLTFKRHLIMFFKEAVHNCARHAHATTVWMSLQANDEHLEISMRDNGCGFDPQAQRDGWGVDSMRKRGEELGGIMKLESAPGEGTSIELVVPLKMLSQNSDHQYKTSN